MTMESKPGGPAPAGYSPAEIECLEAHIIKYYGKLTNVSREIFSTNMRVDVAMTEPTPERDYWVLLTAGMGAKPMNVPKGSREPDRAELMICLPPNWEFPPLDWALKPPKFKMDDDDEQWFWPLRWLKNSASLPHIAGTWLEWGHTIPIGQPFAKNTALCGMLVLNPGVFSKKACRCVLPGGETVKFYQLIPLYLEELMYVEFHGADALLDRMPEEILKYVVVDRKNYCKEE